MASIFGLKKSLKAVLDVRDHVGGGGGASVLEESSPVTFLREGTRSVGRRNVWTLRFQDVTEKIEEEMIKRLSGKLP